MREILPGDLIGFASFSGLARNRSGYSHSRNPLSDRFITPAERSAGSGNDEAGDHGTVNESILIHLQVSFNEAILG